MNDPPPRGDPVIGNSSPEPKEKRMIGDFDGSANPLWTLYGKEAKSYDESRIQTLKDDMDGVLIFVCSVRSSKFDHADELCYRPVYFLLLSPRS